MKCRRIKILTLGAIDYIFGFQFDYYQERLMDTTITIGDALLFLIGICAVILLIYVIRAVRNIIPVLKSLKKILNDAEVVTGLLADTTKNVEETVNSLAASSTDMAEFIAENTSSFKAIVSIVSALVSLKNLFSSK